MKHYNFLQPQRTTENCKYKAKEPHRPQSKR